jgi:hypothetical protein
MSTRYSGKAFKDSSQMKTAKLSTKEKRELKKNDGVKGVIVAGNFDAKLDHAQSMIPNSKVFIYEADFKLKEYK